MNIPIPSRLLRFLAATAWAALCILPAAGGVAAQTAAPTAPPVADAGGPYTIAEGDSLALDGSGSFDPDTDPLTYDWDLDNDGHRLADHHHGARLEPGAGEWLRLLILSPDGEGRGLRSLPVRRVCTQLSEPGR